MTPEQLASGFAVLLALLAGYLPGFQNWYDGFKGPQKALIMGVGLLLVSAGTLAYTCQLETACLTANWQQYANVLIEALKANVATYVIAVRPFKAQ